MHPSTRRSIPSSNIKGNSPKKTLVSAGGSGGSGGHGGFGGVRSSTPSTPTRSNSTLSKPAVTSPPSKSISGFAKDSELTKQADAALNALESTLQGHTDQISDKLEQLTARVNALDESIQDLLRNDFDDPDRSSTPRPNRQQSIGSELEANLKSPPIPNDMEASLLSEESPFFQETY